MSVPPKVLVLEGSFNSSLAIIRSLGASGAEVTVGDHRRISPGLLSRYAKKRILYPDPEENKSAFLDFLENHLCHKHYDLVFPITDFTGLPIALSRERFEAYTKLAIPPTDQILKAADKTETVKVAESCGVKCPKTIVPERIEDLQRIAEDITYPAVVKSRSKVSWVGEKPIVNKVTKRNFVSTPGELVSIYHDVHRRSPLPFIQEVITGEAMGFFALMTKGVPKAVFGHRRLREYPLSGGMSTCRESYMDPELEDQGLRILKALNWDGVAMVEFKKDHRDGHYKLMEINGRWWGSLPLALAAGVDFPKLYCQYLMNGDVKDSPVDFKNGVCCRALLPWDILWLIASLQKPGRIHAFYEFLRPRGFKFDILSLRDPLPIIGSCALIFDYMVQVLRGRLTILGEKN